MNRIALIICLLIPFFGLAQTIKLSDNAGQFIPDVQALMATGGPGAVQAGKDLESLWTDAVFSAPQQEIGRAHV